MTAAQPASIEPPPPQLSSDLTKQALPIVEPKEADGCETDPAKVVEASDTDSAISDAGTTKTDAGTTTTTAKEATPASINPPPPPLDDELTKQALPIAETKEVDGSETDPAKELDASDTDPALKYAGTTTKNAGTTTTTATEAPPASIDLPPPPLDDDVTKHALRHALPKAMDSVQATIIDTIGTGKTPLKVAGQKRKYTKRAKVPVAQVAFKDELFDGDVQAVHGWRSQSRRELWQRGHQTASRPSRIAHEVALVMCDTVKECHTSMRMHGWAILRDMTNAFGPKQQCTEHVDGMFPAGSDACKSVNWKYAQTILRGGVNYQHPHSDTARVNSYAGLNIFPFVCIHAFGQEGFSMRLGPGLPTRSLHRFDAKNMLLMLGDFVHAGAVGTTPRAHMEFFPLEGAGWTRKKSPWTYTAASQQDKYQPTYLWQLPSCPFGYPSVTSPDPKNGNMLVSYPASTTSFLRLPFTAKMCLEDNIEYKEDTTVVLEARRKEARRIDGQEW